MKYICAWPNYPQQFTLFECLKNPKCKCDLRKIQPISFERPFKCLDCVDQNIGKTKKEYFQIHPNPPNSITNSNPNPSPLYPGYSTPLSQDILLLKIRDVVAQCELCEKLYPTHSHIYVSFEAG